MARKSVPDGDADFDRVMTGFAKVIEREPRHYGLAREDVDEINRAAAEFSTALLAARHTDTSSPATIRRKDAARRTAVGVLRRYRNLLRYNESLTSADRLLLGVPLRAAKLRKSKCPQTRPELMFVGSRHNRGAAGKVHVLRFKHPWSKIGDPFQPQSKAKPAGAVRLELFVELVAEDEPIPRHPGELSGGRPWYLRSFTRSPIEVDFPMADRPMRVVYWARWAGAKGDVGPFSQTCIAEVEGWPTQAKALPDPSQVRRRQQRIVITTARMELPEPVEGIEALPAAAERLLVDEAA